MITSVIQLHDLLTVEAALSSIFRGRFEQTLKSSIRWTIDQVGSSLTHSTSHCPTCGTGGSLSGDILQADERRASRIRAICAIWGIKLDLLLLILFDELSW
jgi:hypothetical protein